jgi:hypothetical protein
MLTIFAFSIGGLAYAKAIHNETTYNATVREGGLSVQETEGESMCNIISIVISLIMFKICGMSSLYMLHRIKKGYNHLMKSRGTAEEEDRSVEWGTAEEADRCAV